MIDVEFCQRALLDIRSIQLHYLTYADAASADAHVAAILDGLALLREFPDLGSAVDDPQGVIGVGYRRYLASDFWVYYSHNDSMLTVWRIFHTKQEIDDFAFVDLD